MGLHRGGLLLTLSDLDFNRTKIVQNGLNSVLAIEAAEYKSRSSRLVMDGHPSVGKEFRDDVSLWILLRQGFSLLLAQCSPFGPDHLFLALALLPIRRVEDTVRVIHYA